MCERDEGQVKRFLYQPVVPLELPADSVELNVNEPMRNRMQAMIMRTQDRICSRLEEIDGTAFHEDKWTRKNEGGQGRTRVLQDGKVFEKAGVNISIVQGIMDPQAIQHMKKRGKDLETKGKDLKYFACGISMVLHPHNPMVNTLSSMYARLIILQAPTVHMNYRYFEVDSGRVDENGKPVMVSWFGGRFTSTCVTYSLFIRQ